MSKLFEARFSLFYLQTLTKVSEKIKKMFSLQILILLLFFLAPALAQYGSGQVAYSMWTTSRTCSGTPSDSYIKASPVCLGYTSLSNISGAVAVFACESSGARTFFPLLSPSLSLNLIERFFNFFLIF